MRFYGLIGKTLEHSFSPVFFKEKFEKEGIHDAYYQLYPLKTIDEFNQLISDFSELSGLNVTIPYKQEILPFLDELDPAASEIGAVNTVQFKWQNNKLYLKGYNTDYLGFIESIKPLLKECHTKALILGTGGSSKAVAYALKKLNISFKYVSRDPGLTELLSYSDLDKNLMAEFKIIINTTPLGMFPNIHSKPDIPYKLLTKDHLLFDLVYNPSHTEFLKAGQMQGVTTKNGMEMLVYQAEYAWKIWNNY